MGEPTPESPRANPSVERLDDHASLEKNELVEAEPPNPNNSPSPPLSDGGLQGWLQCLGAFFMFFNSWGIVNTFGSDNPPQLEFPLLIVMSNRSISNILRTTYPSR